MKILFRYLLAISFLLLVLGFQLIKTQLTITVRNELGNAEPGVTVQLYEKEADYNAEENPAAEGITDEKGVVKFKELKAISYYILASKDDKNNFIQIIS